MKTRNLLIVIGISSFSLFTGSLKAQVGTNLNDNNTQSTYYSKSDVNENRLDELTQRVKETDNDLVEAKKELRDAKAASKQAKAAVKAEKQAQKARKDANNQAAKALKAKEESENNR